MVHASCSLLAVVAAALTPTPDRVVETPLRVGFSYSHVTGQSGDLAEKGLSSSALGLDFAFRDGRAIRKHLQIAHQWETAGPLSRKGFRLDLLDLGFPIPIVSRAVYVQVEPILRLLRGQLLFESVAGSNSSLLYRIESGFATQLVVGYDVWFATFAPLSVDFRYVVGNTDNSRSGFATVWSLQGMVGRIF